MGLSDRDRQPKGTPVGGQFAASARAESEVSLEARPSVKDPRQMTRAEILDDPEIRWAPAEWLTDKTDGELAEMLASIRIAKVRFAAEQAEAQAVEEAAASQRRAYRRPEWLKMEKVRDQRRYSTVDGYSASEVVSYGDGRPRLSYIVRFERDEAEVDRVAEIEQWITEHRAGRASSWTEAFPIDSPAANIRAFRGKPTLIWVDESNEGSSSYISADGSYGTVWPDDEPTGHWFVDIEYADGSHGDNLAEDRFWAQRRCEEMLAEGPQDRNG